MFAFSTCFGQRIKFNYDDAGNQIRRYICLLCAARESNDSIFKDSETLTERDMFQDEKGDVVSYYPNPVREELYIKWKIENENYVNTISVYSMNGQLLKEYDNLKNSNLSTISFQSYPEGVYNLIMLFNNGEKKTFKIVKK